MPTILRPKNKKPSAIHLSDEQKRVIAHLAHGGNALVTGSAGTGKSTLLSAIRERLDKHLPVVASTGIAAVNVGGLTIHSWAGLGLAEDEPKVLAGKIMDKGGSVLRRIKAAKRLALDEVSMIHGVLLDKIDEVFRLLRGKPDQAFGGIQMIFFGDFLQLPPVSRGSEQQFAFQSQSWKRGLIEKFLLTKVFRQKDEAFSKALNHIRLGELTPDVLEMLRSRYRPSDPNPEIEPVVMFTHNREVDEQNDARLDAINGKEEQFKAIDKGEFGPLANLQKSCLAPETLRLKVGAQVMLLWNISPEEGLANGSLGEVIGFVTNCPKVRFLNGMEEIIDRKRWEVKAGDEVLASRSQFPLRLAWCITVHKSQGMTLDKIRVYLDRAFEPGQSYVALSRVKTLDGLFIETTKTGAIHAHPDALAFYAAA